MKVSSILLFLAGPLLAYSQDYDSIKNSWDKIIIVDAYWGWSQFKNQFEIKRANGELTLVNSNDSLIKKVEAKSLANLFASLSNTAGISDDPLKIFDKDSVWLISNAKKLWLSNLGERDKPSQVDTFAIKTIKEYHKYKGRIWGFQGSRWTDDYPSTSVFVIDGNDTLFIHSSGQYPYMMPWWVKGKKVFNSGIPTALSEILPDSLKSNKRRLSGEGFEYHLIDEIYSSFIEDYSNNLEARIEYPRQFNILEKYYKIENAALRDMSSIEWGGDVGARCLEVTLKESSVPDNISFLVIFGRRVMLHPVKPIVRKDDKMLYRLSKNMVYQYAIQHSNTMGEIHFVNRKSLSGEAKRSFLTDVKDNGANKSKFRGRFKHAIFFELTERRDKSTSFSRWIFLKDGTNILWEIKGDYLMDLPAVYTDQQGYVCKIIPDKAWIK